ncbi:MAG: ABC transporter permease [Eubacteriales bacterium]|nr:ABC transporter permease [Eubacteriales bacterium]
MKQTSKAAVPYIIWMSVFIVIPLFLIGVFAFTTTVTVDAAGNIIDPETLGYMDGAGIDRETGELTADESEEETDISWVTFPLTEKTIFTLDNIFAVSDYLPVLFLSIWLALIATAICLIISYPLSYMISRMNFQRQNIMLMLVMLPMWMNFLLRTYAWMTLLERNGWINKLLALIGLGPFEMINSQGAVVLGMVYNYLPFMILPLYSIMTKIDERTIESAQDLGAGALAVFGRVILPLSMPGIASGITMVFVPAVSTFIISRMLGGGTNMLIGDLIDLQFLGNAYNPNLGAAMSLVLMIFVLLCMSLTNQLDNEEMESVLL